MSIKKIRAEATVTRRGFLKDFQLVMGTATGHIVVSQELSHGDLNNRLGQAGQ
jgi:hypothetical protein